MGLRQISRTAEEQNALIKRFGIAQDVGTPIPDPDSEYGEGWHPAERPEEGDTGTIEQKLQVQRDLRAAIYKAAMILDTNVAPGPASAQALIHLEAALMWGGKEIFS